MDMRRRPDLRAVDPVERNGWDEYVGPSGSHYMRGWRRWAAAGLALLLLLPVIVFVVATLFEIPGRILHW